MGGIDWESGPGTTQAILLNKNNNNGVILFSYGEHSIPIKVFRFNIFELRIKLFRESSPAHTLRSSPYRTTR